MNINFDTTPEQDTALQRSFDALLDKEKFTLEEFVLNEAKQPIDGHVKRWQEADLSIVLNKLQQYSSKLSIADLTEVAAVAEKYAGQ